MSRGTVRGMRSEVAEPSVDRDAGVALVMVIGVMMVAAIVCVTLVAITLFSSRYTVQTRAGIRAQQAADSGIDSILAQLDGKKYNELYGVCSQSLSVDSIPVTVTTAYTVTHAGSTVVVPAACPLPTDTVVGLTVTAKAVTTNNTNSSKTITRVTKAVITPTPPEVLLDKAIFGESTGGSLTITNNLELLPSGAKDAGGNPLPDAHVYSNGGVACKTSIPVNGSITAAYGDLSLENHCKIGNSVWAKGIVSFSSQTKVTGDVYSASSAATSVSLVNSDSYVTGNVLTNGGIVVQDGKPASGGGIGGTAFSSASTITIARGGIGGSAYAKKNISLDQSKIGADAASVDGAITVPNVNGSSIGGSARAQGAIATTGLTVTGTVSPNSATSFPAVPNPVAVFPAAVGYPGTIAAPKREQFPIVQMTSTEIDKWVAAGWKLTTINAQCSNAQAAINAIADWSSPVLAVFTGCTSPVTFNNGSLTLKNNLAIVSDTGITSVNDMSISTDGDTQRTVYWIVPANAPGVSWNAVAGAAGQLAPTCSPSRDINIGKLKLTKIEFMMYTPCALNWQNGLIYGDPYKGQLYAGSVNISVGFKLQMSSVPVPSLATSAPALTEKADMRLQSRFDLPSN